MNPLDPWREWKKRCAIDLCSAQTQAILRAFAYNRFLSLASRYAHHTNVKDARDLTPPQNEAWHCFESYMAIDSSKSGKCYKKWLFARHSGDDADQILAGVMSGSMLVLRDAVRDRFRKEFSTHLAVSIDAPLGVGGGDESPCLSELLPGPIDGEQQVQELELESLASAEGNRAMNCLGRRERIAILARDLGRSLDDPAVTRAAGCSKTMLHVAYNGALISLAGLVRSRYHTEDTATLSTLTIKVFERVKAGIQEWAKSERKCERLLAT